MKGDTRCVDGRLMRHDPQDDDPSLETDRGVCPDCDGEGCERPKVQFVDPMLGYSHTVIITFTKPLKVKEFRDFDEYVREWEQ